MALLASAGFLGLHALATPGILIDHTTAGFSVAARVWLLLAAGFAAVSALGADSRVVRVLARHHREVRAVLWVVLAAWAVASLARVPLQDRPLPPDAVPPPLGLLALVGVALYKIAAVRYAELYRRRHRLLPLAVLVALVLLAEAMIAVAFSRTWHAMWWEWHVLMAVAFGAILVAARVEYRREGSSQTARVHLVTTGGLAPGLMRRMGRASVGHNDAKAPGAWLSACEGRRSGWGVRFGVPGPHPTP